MDVILGLDHTKKNEKKVPITLPITFSRPLTINVVLRYLGTGLGKKCRWSFGFRASSLEMPELHHQLPSTCYLGSRKTEPFQTPFHKSLPAADAPGYIHLPRRHLRCTFQINASKSLARPRLYNSPRVEIQITADRDFSSTRRRLVLRFFQNGLQTSAWPLVSSLAYRHRHTACVCSPQFPCAPCSCSLEVGWKDGPKLAPKTP